MDRAREPLPVHGEDEPLRVEGRLDQHPLGKVGFRDRRVVAVTGKRLVQEGDERGQVRGREVP